jgi:hypothetical protein
MPQSASSGLGDISGTYTFLQEGESVQITMDPSAPDPKPVDGIVSRLGDQDSDKGQLLDHFFTKGSLQGDRLTFKTKIIHDVWFEFTGTVTRDPAKKSKDEGRIVITGMLKRFHQEGKTPVAQERELTMKLFPDLDSPDTP